MAFLFALLFILLILTFARQAWHNGVLTQYWGILGLAAGLVAGYIFFQYSGAILERLAPDRHLPLLPNVIASAVVGLIVYFIVRGIVKSVLSSAFGGESSLQELTDGMSGAILSLIPSVITVVILASGLRLGGTLMELRHLENICRPQVDFTTKNYPSWSFWAKWRDSVEKIPFVKEGLYFVDPISRVPERRIVCLLVASKKPDLFEFLKLDPATASIFKSDAMRDAMDSNEIAVLLNKYQHVTLIRHSMIEKVARDPEIEEALETLDLQLLIDGFMLSPEKQERLKRERVL